MIATAGSTMDLLAERGRLLLEQAMEIWISGGWAMLGIAAVALLMFGLGFDMQLRLRAKKFLAVPEKRWRLWLDQPELRKGPIGKLIGEVTAGKTLKQTLNIFREVRKRELAPFSRDLRVMKICVNAAPLLGLLGTVVGMLTTFGALSTGSGGDQTMEKIAAGISEALVTTETGLIVALPGLFFQYQLTRKHERYKAFLAHLETVCTQYQHRRNRQAELAEELDATAGRPGGAGATQAPAVEPPVTRDAESTDEPSGTQEAAKPADASPSDQQSTGPAGEASTATGEDPPNATSPPPEETTGRATAEQEDAASPKRDDGGQPSEDADEGEAKDDRQERSDG